MSDKKYIVYKHTNKINKKIYIGITSRKPEERWGKNGENYYSSPHFMSAIKKFGWENFEHEILFENLTEEEACDKEIEMIKKFNSNDPLYGYNCTTGGEMFKMNEIAREKKSLAMKGNKNGCTPCTKEKAKKISEALKGKKFSEERKKNISNAKKGKTHKKISEDGIEKIKNSDYHNGKKRKVYCPETDTVYESIHECARAFGDSKIATAICAVCNGRYKAYKNYHFYYV